MIKFILLLLILLSNGLILFILYSKFPETIPLESVNKESKNHTIENPPSNEHHPQPLANPQPPSQPPAQPSANPQPPNGASSLIDLDLADPSVEFKRGSLRSVKFIN